jgi:NADH:ubiquinone oxidoreductase subunit 5 (subunit L)/multisubunit Na+/H+ antiporter MnhA subunit
MENPAINPAAPHHLPGFIAGPGQSDWLMTVMLVFLLVSVVSVGLLYLKLHALPEHMAHRTNKVQLQFVAVLALLALFTHNHVFWIAALLLALVDLPDFSAPMNSIALSLEKLSGRDHPIPPPPGGDLLSDEVPPGSPPAGSPPPAAPTGDASPQPEA